MRAGSSVVAFAFVAVAVALLLGDAVIRGSWLVAARASGVALLVLWAAWLLLIRPSIRVLPDRAVVTNVGRITEVPWSRIVAVRRRLQLILDLDDGRRVEAWGSPFPKRRLAGRSAASEADDPAATALRAAWLSGDDSSSAIVVRRADTLALLIGAGALAAAILTLTWAGAA